MNSRVLQIFVAVSVLAGAGMCRLGAQAAGSVGKAPDAGHVAALTSLPIVLIAITGGAVAPAWNALSDVLVHEGDPSLDDIVATTAAHPLAAMTLALLLRGSHRRTLDDGLVADGIDGHVEDGRLPAPPRPCQTHHEATGCRSCHDLGGQRLAE